MEKDLAKDYGQIKEKQEHSFMAQQLELLLFMISVALSAITIATSDQKYLYENIIMFVILGAILLFVVNQFRFLATVLSGLQVVVYAVYKIFSAQVTMEKINWQAFLWVVIPFMMTGSLLFFLRSNYQMEQLTNMIQNQIADMALVNPLTGLYNLKALYVDLERQISHAARRDAKICLMLIELRYGPELKSALPKSEYQGILQRVARIAEDSIRLEDRCYTIDDEGGLGIIINCDSTGAMIVKNRIKNKAQDKTSFEGVIDRALKVDLRIAFLEYNKEEIHNAIEFKQKTENEMQYDV